MPSHGALSNPNDIAVIKELEDKMLEAFGNAVVTRACEAAGKTKKRKVNLEGKMIRLVHVPTLCTAVNTYRVRELNLPYNQLGPDGAKELARFLRVNTSLESLEIVANGLGPEGGVAIAEAMIENASLKSLTLWGNNIGAEAGMAFAESLKINNSLMELK